MSDSGEDETADGLSQVLMLSDGNAEWSEKLGLKSGERTKRYAIIIDDLVVKSVEVSHLAGQFLSRPLI